MSKVRAYCGTLNNYSEDDYTQLHDNLMALLAASRLVYAMLFSFQESSNFEAS